MFYIVINFDKQIALLFFIFTRELISEMFDFIHVIMFCIRVSLSIKS